MRFSLIDRITLLEIGQSITAIKTLSMAEEYLQDHFPRYPVMPGVLMLEASYQASCWLVRATEDFAHSVILLKEAKNVKFGNFVKPGQFLTVVSSILKSDAETTSLKIRAEVEGETAFSGRIVLETHNLADSDPSNVAADLQICDFLREQFRLLTQDSI